jgi:hypothetical protein
MKMVRQWVTMMVKGQHCHGVFQIIITLLALLRVVETVIIGINVSFGVHAFIILQARPEMLKEQLGVETMVMMELIHMDIGHVFGHTVTILNVEILILLIGHHATAMKMQLLWDMVMIVIEWEENGVQKMDMTIIGMIGKVVVVGTINFIVQVEVP